MKPLAWLPPIVASVAIASPAFAQPIAAISLPSGRSTTIDAPGLTRVAVGDGRIAGVVPVGTQQVIVNAKAPGHTTVLVWTNAGRREYDVTVTEQTLDDLAQMMRMTINLPAVSVDPVGRALVVKGDVTDQAQANRVADVVGRFAALAKNQKYDIVNAVTVSRPLGALQAELERETGARDVRVDYDNKGNVMVSGRVRDRASAEAVLQRVRGLAGANLAADGKIIDRLALDVNQQVDTHVYILEVDKTVLSQLGIRLQGAFVDAGGVVHYNDPSFPIFENPADVGAPGKGTIIGRFIRAEFLAPTLDALIRNGNARILSSPDLLTMPGSNATFLVGGEVPYVVSSNLGTYNVQFKEYGVKLNVTPTILPDGTVESKITPEVSDLDFQDGITVGGITLPSFKTSRITTDIVTKPGESIVMGGLLRRQEQRNVDKIPGLGDLPILGKLFRSTRYQKQETDVVFVMTPEVITR
ncbi:MAG TPA: pilus assembly protein N-terminal domain-containing protein [Candidatus Elarobacter sp.]|nr:pilus assembly protein N-terminal domain-containing protein [Candidatus Elarobacter sp.]